MLIHSPVRVQIRDIVHPRPVEVLCALYGESYLHGEVVGVTDDGQEPAGFLLVKVPGVDEVVIVPAAKAIPEPWVQTRAGTGE